MAGLLTGPASTDYQSLFVPAVCLLIIFLGYSSQWLFNVAENLEPGPMTKRESAILNILLVCLWLTYYKACTVPPGRYDFLPKTPPTSNKSDDPQPASKDGETSDKKTAAEQPTTQPDPESKPTTTTPPTPTPTTRWCKKCDAPKPLRAHHCRLCKTCIPKMDHHCPWTNNCVSLQTFPYFLRFLVYTNLALGYLIWWLLYPRLRLIFWDNSALPSYLGPSVPVLIHLVLLAIVGCLVSFALVILLVTTLRGWVLNITMIEGWEQERHEAVLLRSRRAGWWTGSGAGGDAGAAGGKVKIERVEFPYDIGFFANMAQAMGTRNILTWLDPLIGGGPRVSREVGKGTGWEWEENGFNDREGMWPPTDPEKLRRAAAGGGKGWPGSEAARQEAELVDKRWASPQDEMAAFRARQEMDLRRRRGTSGVIAELGEDEGIEDLEEYDYVDQDSGGSGGYYDEDDDDEEEEEGEGGLSGKAVPVIPGQGYYERGFDGEPGWTNSEGDRLRDFGVDEDVDDDDDDVPLGELLRRRKAYGKDR